MNFKEYIKDWEWIEDGFIFIGIRILIKYQYFIAFWMIFAIFTQPLIDLNAYRLLWLNIVDLWRLVSLLLLKICMVSAILDLIIIFSQTFLTKQENNLNLKIKLEK